MVWRFSGFFSLCGSNVLLFSTSKQKQNDVVGESIRQKLRLKVNF